MTVTSTQTRPGSVAATLTLAGLLVPLAVLTSP